MSELPQTAPKDEEVATVEDPEEYARSQRLEDIFNARRELRYIRRRADFENDWEALRAYRAAVATYAAEVEPLFLKYDAGEYVWFKKDFGTVAVAPQMWREQHRHHGEGWGVKVRKKNGRGREKAVVKERPEPVEYDLIGIESLFELPNPIEETFHFEEVGRHSSYRVRTVTEQISFATLDEIYRATNRFLADIGFELDPDDSPNDATADYSDILDE